MSSLKWRPFCLSRKALSNGGFMTSYGIVAHAISSISQQAITWTNADVLSISPSGTNLWYFIISMMVADDLSPAAAWHQQCNYRLCVAGMIRAMHEIDKH